MIFVALGTQKFQFNRLLKYIDDLIKNNEINEEVFAQIGNSDYMPKNFKYKDFLSKDEYNKLINESDLTITHAGVGSIVPRIKENKPTIIVPRLKRFGEHIDDHQLQIAEAFESEGYVLNCGENIEKLKDLISKSKVYKFKKYDSANEKIQTLIQEYMNRKKVLMIGSNPKYTKGGISSVISNYLAYNNWKNYEIDFLESHRDGDLLCKMIIFAKALLILNYKLLFENYSIAHIHVSERGSMKRKIKIVNEIKRISPQTKIVLHHHGAEFDEYYNSVNEKEKNKIREMLKKVDVNIVLSENLVTTITSKQPEANVKVLYNAVQPNELKNYNDNKNGILFLGRFGHRKGIYDLLDVLTQIRSKLESNNIEVYLCGDGEIDEVKEFVKNNNLENVVKHVGWVDATEKSKIIKKIIINVLPSYNEGLPMTILETMSHGIPSISTNVGSIPEVIINNENGYLITPGDKESLKKYLCKLIDEPDLRKKLSENSLNTITDKFSLDKNIHKLEYEIYDDINSV